MVGYLFAGQGAQYIGMGKDLYEAFPEAKAVFDQADKVLGLSISRLCFQGPAEELTRTQNCQPAILTVSIAAYEAFKSVTSDQLPVTSYVAGLSLGEYSALVASQALSFADAVYLVRRRGEFMEEAARKYPGKMISILGLGLELVKDICQESDTEIANLNCPGQFVISGGIKQLEQAERLAKLKDAKMVISLEVSGAFHSSLMQEAGLKLAKELDDIKINELMMPVVSNVNAQPFTSTLEIKENLVKQITSCVRWEDSMRFMLAQGITKFFEFGPGKVLKGLMRRIEPKAEVTNIEKKEDILKSDIR